MRLAVSIGGTYPNRPPEGGDQLGAPVESFEPEPGPVQSSYDDPQTAASSAATHNQFAAVAPSPDQGPAGPAPGWGPTAGGGGTPAPPPQQPPTQGIPPGLPGGPPVGAAARPAEAPAEPSTTTVESLLDETRARPPQREAGRTGKGGKGRKEKEELSGPVLQEKVMRLSIIIVIVIAVIGYVAGAVRSSAAGKGGLFDNGVFDIIGVFALGAALYLLVNAVRVGGKTKEVESQTEKSRLAYITLGGILLWLVPLVGSFGYNLGLVFQSSAMHPVYYVFVAVGVIAILVGLSGSKERSSFYKVFMFAVYGVVLATLPMAFPAFGNVLASDFWWSSTFIMISVGFVFIAFTLRQMRQGQYSQLDDVVAKADRAFAARQYDQAARFYSEAITLTHTLYSDSVFATRPYGDRRQVEVPEQYFKPWIGKAKCMALTGKLRKALAIYDLMLEVDQSNARVWHDRGRILVAEKRYAEAYISFDKAIKLDPTLDDARERRNEVLDVIRKMAD